jgi:hypothetical protein
MDRASREDAEAMLYCFFKEAAADKQLPPAATKVGLKSDHLITGRSNEPS